MWRSAGPAIVLLVTLAGCGGNTPSSAVTDVRPVELPTVAAGRQANLTLFVMNVVDRRDRVRVEMNGERALDAVFPSAEGSAHPPIFSYRFAVPEGHTTVRVRTSRENEALRFLMTEAPRWVVVQNQNQDPERIPVHLEVYDKRPVFG